MSIGSRMAIDPRLWTDLHAALAQQQTFSDKFFDASSLNDAQKQEMLKTFVLSLHSEATGIVEAVNYKDHRGLYNPVNVQKILYKSVDAYRYILAILNLWNIDAETFVAALSQKDDYLHFRHQRSGRKLSPGQPIVLFDMDDVLAEFRSSFCEYATQTTGVFIDPMSDEYYNLSTFRRHSIDADAVFRSFIDSHGFSRLEVNPRYAKLMSDLRAAGRWIQIVTARPAEDLTCFYDTHSWLAQKGLDVDGVTFTPEKFKWLAEQPFHGKHPVLAVDDSAKHAAEYAKHGVQVLVPQKTYNAEVAGLQNVHYVGDDIDLMSHVESKQI